MRNYSIYTLKTKLEFTNLYQYLSEKDYKQLEQQILCHSYHTPICTWNGIVINGIEAYELFRKHSIPFRIKRLHFSSKEDVISWICTDQLKREDLTNINKKYLIGKKYDAEKIIVLFLMYIYYNCAYSSPIISDLNSVCGSFVMMLSMENRAIFLSG